MRQDDCNEIVNAFLGQTVTAGWCNEIALSLYFSNGCGLVFENGSVRLFDKIEELEDEDIPGSSPELSDHVRIVSNLDGAVMREHLAELSVRSNDNGTSLKVEWHPGRDFADRMLLLSEVPQDLFAEFGCCPQRCCTCFGKI